MKINITLFDNDKIKEYNFNETYILNKDFPFKIKDIIIKDKFNINFNVKKIPKTLIVKGNFKGDLIVNCDKCGKEYVYPLENNFNYFLMSDLEDNTSSNVIDITNLKEIDLKEYIREDIILSLPDTYICKDNCKGLCPECGINLNDQNCKCKKNDINMAFEEAIDLFK